MRGVSRGSRAVPVPQRKRGSLDDLLIASYDGQRTINFPKNNEFGRRIMKILTWNINGIRSVKKDYSLKKLFDCLDADIICLQETKVTREMLEEETATVEGYNAYFSFSKVRSGYSGVATFCRNHVTPIKAENKIHLPNGFYECDEVTGENSLTNEDLESLNAEGRSVVTDHLDEEGNHVVIMNLYCPRADLDNKDRTRFKLKFYSLVERKCKSLVQENKHVIVLGDFNVSHKLLDHCDPDDPEIFDSNPSRKWANTFIWEPRNDQPKANTSSPLTGDSQSTGTGPENMLREVYEESKANDQPQNTKFIDSFRYFHPCQKSAFTCWSTLTGARQTNYGTRIDYIFSSVDFFKKEFTDCIIRPDIEGSDHCPVIATLKTSFQNGGKPPALCTKYMPEFSGKQQKLKSFFKKSIENTHLSNVNENRTNEIYEKKVPLKSSEKRPPESLLKTQAKRFKSNASTSQGKISQFFEKKNTKAHSNKRTDNISEQGDCCKLRLPNTNESNNSSQTSSSGDSKSLSSQDLTQLDEERQEDSQRCAERRPNQTTEGNSAAVISSWKNLLKGPAPAPLCSGHKEPCVLRTVKNNGPNHGKRFYCCARPQGHSTNKEARCNYFTWVKK